LRTASIAARRSGVSSARYSSTDFAIDFISLTQEKQQADAHKYNTGRILENLPYLERMILKKGYNMNKGDIMLSYLGDVNWWAVIVCAVLSMVVGYLWYGPLFSKPWGEMTGWTKDKVAAIPMNKFAVSYLLAFIAAFVISSVLAIVLRAVGAEGIGDGIVTAIVLWVGFTGATIGINMIFERKPLSLFGIQAGFHLVVLMVYSVVLSLW